MPRLGERGRVGHQYEQERISVDHLNCHSLTTTQTSSLYHLLSSFLIATTCLYPWRVHVNDIEASSR